jgi:octopine/nopaline transport system ATP-binding protein
MEFSSLVDRIGGEAAAAWDIHFEARRAQGLGRDVIVLSVGDPDFPTPSGIVGRAVSALEGGDTHYAEISGRTRLREAIAGRLAERHGLPVAIDGVMPFAGTQNAMFATCLCLFERGDEVLAFDPMYLTYEATVRASGAEVVRVPVVGDGSFRPDVEALVEAATPQTKGTRPV